MKDCGSKGFWAQMDPEPTQPPVPQPLVVIHGVSVHNLTKKYLHYHKQDHYICLHEAKDLRERRGPEEVPVLGR